MALALADSISSWGWDLADQMKRYIQWWSKGEYSVNGTWFDIGLATRAALAKFQRTNDPLTSGDPSEHASGNGSIMRLAPVPIHFGFLYPERIDELARYAEESSPPPMPATNASLLVDNLGVLLAALIHGMRERSSVP